MKSYTITVNGNVYDVTVEENGSSKCTGSSTEEQLQQQHRQRQQLRQPGMAQEALRLKQEQQEKYSRWKHL